LADLGEAELDDLLAAAVTAPLTPSTLTNVGALRAEIMRVRVQGWALVDGELEPGLRSIAAPVHSQNGRVVAAINVSTSATRYEMNRLREEYLPQLLQTTKEIDADLRRI